MSYAYYEIDTPEGKPMRRGYSVTSKCFEKGCKKKIDRGMAYLCYGCTLYFCEDHQVIADSEFDCFAGASHQACKGCDEKYPVEEQTEEEPEE